MGARQLVLLAALLCGLAWWVALRPDPVARTPVPGAANVAAGCQLPPRVADAATPLQSPVPDGLTLPGVGDAATTALAGFSVEARVLGREDYRFDREAAYAPLDLALGWGRMTEEAVVSRLDITQSGRWYRYRWQAEPPIPLAEIVRSSANMHMVPANPAVAADLARIAEGDRVRVDGWLVQLDRPGGWRWRSSLTREDSGGGACELVYVCAVTRL